MAEVSTLKSEIVDQYVLNFLAQPQSRKGEAAFKCLAVKNPGPRFVEKPGPRFVENPGPRFVEKSWTQICRKAWPQVGET